MEIAVAILMTYIGERPDPLLSQHLASIGKPAGHARTVIDVHTTTSLTISKSQVYYMMIRSMNYTVSRQSLERLENPP